MIVSGGREHLPPGGRGHARAAPGGGRRGRLRRARSRDGGGGQGRRAARSGHPARPGARSRATSPSAATTSRTTSVRDRWTSPTSCRAARTASSTSGCCATLTGPARRRAPAEPRAAGARRRTRPAPGPTPAPKSRTSVMPTAVTTGPMSRLPRPTVPPNPIIHRASTRPRTFSCSRACKRGVQCGDEGEVEGTQHGHVDVGRAPWRARARRRRGRGRSRRGRCAPGAVSTLREHGPDGQRPAHRSHPEAGVENAVLGPLREVDAEVVGGHHGHLADEGQSQQREHEDGDQATPDHRVEAGHGDACRELAPTAGVDRRLAHGGQGDHQQRQDDEEIGDGVEAEDPGRAHQ